MNIKNIESLPEDLKDKLDARIYEDWDELVEALFQLAKGIYREEAKTGKDGVEVTRIYQEKPNKEVAQYLVDRVLGKPKPTADDKPTDQPMIIQISKEIADKYNVKATDGDGATAQSAGGDSEGQPQD